MTTQEVRSAALGCGASAAAIGVAAAARRRSRRRAMRRPVETVMATDVATVDPASSLADAAERLADAEAGALPVCEEDRLIGVISDRDIVVRSLAQGEDPSRVRVGNCVTPEPATIAPSAPLEDAVRLMSERAVRRLPVVRDGAVVGMLSEHDVALNAPRSRVGALVERLAAAPSDTASGAVLFRRPHGPRRETATDGSRGDEMDRAVEVLRAMR
jgi:CBS domain-containing protein